VSLEFLRSKVPADLLDDLALLLGFCFDCGGSLSVVGGEVVCEKCGRVWGVENVDESVPFPEAENVESGVHFEGHWQPRSSLAFLKGIGDPTLDNCGGRGLMRVLAKAPSGGEDLGIRARMIKLIAQSEDPPQLRRILRRISQLLDKLGFRGSHELADYTGNLARKIVAFTLIAHIQVPTRMADAIVKHTLQKLQLKSIIDAQILDAKDEDLHFVEWFEESIKEFKLKEAYSRRSNQP
jgi:hypothetical protein